MGIEANLYIISLCSCVLLLPLPLFFWHFHFIQDGKDKLSIAGVRIYK